MLEGTVHTTPFRRIKYRKGKDFNCCYLALGQNHCAALGEAKTIPYTWGDNDVGQLGIGQSKKHHNLHVSEPTALSSLEEVLTV